MGTSSGHNSSFLGKAWWWLPAASESTASLVTFHLFWDPFMARRYPRSPQSFLEPVFDYNQHFFSMIEKRWEEIIPGCIANSQGEHQFVQLLFQIFCTHTCWTVIEKIFLTVTCALKISKVLFKQRQIWFHHLRSFEFKIQPRKWVLTESWRPGAQKCLLDLSHIWCRNTNVVPSDRF